MNVLAVLTIVISVLLVFIGKEWRWTGPAVGRPSDRNLTPGAFHSTIGAIAVGITLMQPLGALMRCNNGSKYRPIFNWSHRISGLTAFVLAMIAILLAVLYFHVWVARWWAILFFIIYLILVTVLIALAQLANSRKHRQASAVTYQTDGYQYRGEQVNVITKGIYNHKAKKLVAAVVITFIVLAALIVLSMVLLIVFS